MLAQEILVSGLKIFTQEIDPIFMIETLPARQTKIILN